MRIRIVLLLTLISSVTLAAPKDVTAVMKDSVSAREAAAAEKDSGNKIKKLKEYEKSLNATIQDYEKESPAEGGPNEEKVVKFSYRFEPVFELAGKKISKADCEKTKARIAFEDRGNKGEDAKLTDAAEEALKWVEVFCK